MFTLLQRNCHSRAEDEEGFKHEFISSFYKGAIIRGIMTDEKPFATIVEELKIGRAFERLKVNLFTSMSAAPQLKSCLIMRKVSDVLGLVLLAVASSYSTFLSSFYFFFVRFL